MTPILIILPSIIVCLGIYFREMKMCLQKNLHTIVYSSFICNSQKLETTKMSLSRWLVKQTLVHRTMDSSSGMKRSELCILATTWMDLKSIMPGERAHLQNSYTIVQFTLHFQNYKIIDMENELTVARG